MSRIRFSRLRGRPLQGPSGNEVGKVADCVVRLTDGALPQVTGVLLRLAGREVYISGDDVADITPEGVRLSANRVDTRPFDRRPGEVLLQRDVIGRAVIDVVGARLVRVGDLVIEGEGRTWRIVAVVSSVAFSPLRTLRRLFRREPPAEELEWTRIEPLTSHVPSVAREIPLLRMAGLRPADIANIVEKASHDEGREILEAVQQDHELEADVFEELNDEHQVEFARERSDEEVASLLARMEADDAADLLLKLDQDRRRHVLELVPERQRENLRRLLGYNPETAGGLMGNEFIAMPEDLTVGEALERVRRLDYAPTRVIVVYSLKDGRLSGAVRLFDLVRAEPERTLMDVGDRHPVAVFPDTDIPTVAVEMADYNLAALPVVDAGGRILGIVTYDDLIETMIRPEWRWRTEADQGYRYESEKSGVAPPASPT
jgi:CBS domain-containing protein/sporulation protein YlmC with PRC-barrel domain